MVNENRCLPILLWGGRKNIIKTEKGIIRKNKADLKPKIVLITYRQLSPGYGKSMKMSGKDGRKSDLGKNQTIDLRLRPDASR